MFGTTTQADLEFKGFHEGWREDKMGGGGGREGRKIFGFKEHPSGAIVPQNGILGADDIPLKVSLEDEIGPKGCSPEGPLVNDPRETISTGIGCKQDWPEGVFPRRAIGQ